MRVAVTLTLFFLGTGIAFIIDSVLKDYGIDDITFSAVGAFGAIMALVGLCITRQSPLLGGTLAVIGPIPMSLIAWWSIFMPVLALLLAVFGFIRAQRLAKQQEPSVEFTSVRNTATLN